MRPGNSSIDIAWLYIRYLSTTDLISELRKRGAKVINFCGYSIVIAKTDE